MKDLNNLQILVADDDIHSTIMVSSMLKSLGITKIESKTKSEDVLSFLTEGEFKTDILFIGSKMKGIKTYPLIEWMLSHPDPRVSMVDIVVIMTTPTQKETTQISDIPIVDLLYKPIMNQPLKLVLARILKDSLNENSERNLLKKINVLSSFLEYGHAIELVKFAIRMYGMVPNFLVKYATLLLKIDENEKAKNLLLRTLDINKKSLSAMTVLIEVYLALFDIDKAEETLKVAQEISDLSTQRTLLELEILFLKNKLEQTESVSQVIFDLHRNYDKNVLMLFKKSLILELSKKSMTESELVMFLNSKAENLIKNDRLDESIIVYKIITNHLDTEKKDHEFFFKMALAYQKKNDLFGTIDSLRKCLKIAPEGKFDKAEIMLKELDAERIKKLAEFIENNKLTIPSLSELKENEMNAIAAGKENTNKNPNNKSKPKDNRAP